MTMMKALALTSLLALGGTAALAQAPAGPPAAETEQAAPRERGKAPLSRADLDSLTDARIAGIQAGLKLTPDQQRLWAPVEEALRSAAAERAERMESRRERRTERRSEPRPDMMERLEHRAERASRRAERATTLATAMKPLWESLDENQKRILPILMRQGGMMHGHGPRIRHAMHHGGGHHGAMHGRMHGQDRDRGQQQD